MLVKEVHEASTATTDVPQFYNISHQNKTKLGLLFRHVSNKREGEGKRFDSDPFGYKRDPEGRATWRNHGWVSTFNTLRNRMVHRNLHLELDDFTQILGTVPPEDSDAQYLQEHYYNFFKLVVQKVGGMVAQV